MQLLKSINPRMGIFSNDHPPFSPRASRDIVFKTIATQQAQHAVLLLGNMVKDKLISYHGFLLFALSLFLFGPCP